MKRMTSAKEAEDSLQDILLREIKSRANVSTKFRTARGTFAKDVEDLSWKNYVRHFFDQHPGFKTTCSGCEKSYDKAKSFLTHLRRSQIARETPPGPEGYTCTWEPACHVPKELVEAFLKDAQKHTTNEDATSLQDNRTADFGGSSREQDQSNDEQKALQEKLLQEIGKRKNMSTKKRTNKGSQLQGSSAKLRGSRAPEGKSIRAPL